MRKTQVKIEQSRHEANVSRFVKARTCCRTRPSRACVLFRHTSDLIVHPSNVQGIFTL